MVPGRISDLENMDVMIWSVHYEGGDSEFGNSVKRLESLGYHALIEHNSSSSSNSIEIEIR